MKKHIFYTIRRDKRARRVTLKIYRNNSFVVTVPKSSSYKLVKSNVLKRIREILSSSHVKSSNYCITNSKKDFLKNKERARSIIEERVCKFNQFYNFKINRVAIRNQRTKWGSCSTKKNLNFNYRIIYLPDRLIDYIVVHELCHLKEMNHSKSFWDLVSKTIPEYDFLRKELKNS